jgi:threonyl-tRNA synthetase
VHRAIVGSLERWLGIAIENYAGHFPLWIAPTQVVVATITSEADQYAAEVGKLLKGKGMRVHVDTRNEKINYKVREHSVGKVPVILVVGKREMDERAINMRRLGSQDQKVMGLDDAVAALLAEAMPPDLR